MQNLPPLKLRQLRLSEFGKVSFSGFDGGEDFAGEPLLPETS
jgi:hypothetical protein